MVGLNGVIFRNLITGEKFSSNEAFVVSTTIFVVYLVMTFFIILTMLFISSHQRKRDGMMAQKDLCRTHTTGPTSAHECVAHRGFRRHSSRAADPPSLYAAQLGRDLGELAGRCLALRYPLRRCLCAYEGR